MVAIYYKDGRKKMNKLYDDDILSVKKRAVISLSNNARTLQKEFDKTKDIQTYRMLLATKQEINKVLGIYTAQVDLSKEAENIEGFSIKDLIGI